MKKVFVTCDMGLFRGCEWYGKVEVDHALCKDIRTLDVADLRDHDAVIHLAALSNDPMGNVNPRLTEDINHKGAVYVARLAKLAGVKRFLFAGSCSVYGKGEKLHLDETAPLAPLTPYAKSKVDAEADILALKDLHFTPVSLRLATAYGSSPLLRLDLVVNQLVAMAYTEGRIALNSDGSSWRPLIHCKDIAAAFVSFLFADAALVKGEAFNVGTENTQIFALARMIQEFFPHSHITFGSDSTPDPRSYCVTFDKLKKALPAFQPHYSLQKGIGELIRDFQVYGLSQKELFSSKFIRLKHLEETRVLSVF